MKWLKQLLLLYIYIMSQMREILKSIGGSEEEFMEFYKKQTGKDIPKENLEKILNNDLFANEVKKEMDAKKKWMDLLKSLSELSEKIRIFNDAYINKY